MTRILVIDDIPLMREGIAEKLRLNGYDVEIAVNGLQGLQIAREILPDVIISDIMMPELDGYGVLKALRSNSMTATIPFIFLTAKSERPEIRAGMELGADDYLIKPFQEQELLAAVKARLNMRDVLKEKQLRTLTRKALQQRDVEYRSLAHQIHDEITQPLAGLKLSLHGIHRLSHNELDEKIAKIQKQVDHLHTQISVTTHELWPFILDDIGLAEALIQMFERFQAQSGINAHFKYNRLDKVSSPDVKITIYRVIEEAVTNVEKHAGVADMNITVWVEDDRLQFDISDEGVGFDLESVASGTSSGLVEMNERIITVGGEINILSEPDAGVQILGHIPIAVDANLLKHEDHVVNLTAMPMDDKSKVNSSGTTDDRLRIVLAEDNHIIREGLKHLLEEIDTFKVIGEATQRDSLLRMVWDLQPDLLILSMMLSGSNTLDLIQPIRNFLSDLRILIFSGYTNDMYVHEAFKRGATGYVLNNIEASKLVNIVQQVGNGKTYWHNSTDDDNSISSPQPPMLEDSSLSKYSSLTAREREILPLVAQGHTSKEIANILSISPRTVETHRSNIASKLGLRTQAELIHYAIKNGLVMSD